MFNNTECKSQQVHSICISRTPNVEIYEGLIEFVHLLENSGLNVHILLARLPQGEPRDKIGSVMFHEVRVAKQRFAIPTVLRLLLRGLLLGCKLRPSILVGLDSYGSFVASIIGLCLGKQFICYSLELPCKKGDPKASLLSRLEHWALRRASLVVTMDRHHSLFITQEAGVKPEKFCFLPVARGGSVRRQKTNFLREKFGLSRSDVVILHAGGVGAAQESLQLAQSASSWPSNWHLVFHLHCRLEHESYFQEFARIVEELPNVHISSEPVDPAALDELVSSADVTIAWYERELLGYRADLLGLAPGKVGRSLRNGVPVVVKDLFSIREYVDNYKCGFCAATLVSIPDGIRMILKDHECFKKNARKCFEELWRPERYLPELERRVKILIHGEAE